jgi:hypothetical protein
MRSIVARSWPPPWLAPAATGKVGPCSSSRSDRQLWQFRVRLYPAALQSGTWPCAHGPAKLAGAEPTLHKK